MVAMGMNGPRERVARGLLVDGYPVRIGGVVRRMYPAHAQVARELQVPTSTITRWAERNGIAAARRARLAQDAHDGSPERLPLEELPGALLAVVTARLRARRPISTRDLDRIGRLLEWLVGLAGITTRELKEAEGMLARLFEGRTA